jgi:hypothetical protein
MSMRIEGNEDIDYPPRLCIHITQIYHRAFECIECTRCILADFRGYKGG